jgi:hypothetical protein
MHVCLAVRARAAGARQGAQRHANAPVRGGGSSSGRDARERRRRSRGVSGLRARLEAGIAGRGRERHCSCVDSGEVAVCREVRLREHSRKNRRETPRARAPPRRGWVALGAGGRLRVLTTALSTSARPAALVLNFDIRSSSHLPSQHLARLGIKKPEAQRDEDNLA